MRPFSGTRKTKAQQRGWGFGFGFGFMALRLAANLASFFFVL
jgi:hypothetical protein